jgi:hypothetical protein
MKAHFAFSILVIALTGSLAGAAEHTSTAHHGPLPCMDSQLSLPLGGGVYLSKTGLEASLKNEFGVGFFVESIYTDAVKRGLSDSDLAFEKTENKESTNTVKNALVTVFSLDSGYQTRRLDCKVHVRIERNVDSNVAAAISFKDANHFDSFDASLSSCKDWSGDTVHRNIFDPRQPLTNEAIMARSNRQAWRDYIAELEFTARKHVNVQGALVRSCSN